jgi:MFS family permease
MSETATVIGFVLLSAAQYIGSIISLLFGRRLTWLWVALATFAFFSRAVSLLLFRETVLLRIAAMLAGGLLAAMLALLLSRRYPKATLLVGGFLAAGFTAVQLFGPLLNPFPEWIVIGVLVFSGIVGSVWTNNNPELAGMILSAFIGASLLTSNLMENLDLIESLRFQVLMAVTLIGIVFQLWRRGVKSGEQIVSEGEAAA